MTENDWRPIETAPTDRAPFLAYEDGSYYKCAFSEWHDEDAKEPTWSVDCGQYATLTPEPTHWMPLPEPPTT